MQEEWYARLEMNSRLRAALDWMDKTEAVEAGLYLFGRLGRFWYYDLQEAQRWAIKFIQKVESIAFPRARIKALNMQSYILNGLEQSVLARSAGGGEPGVIPRLRRPTRRG